MVARLGVNIDHVATLRQLRGTDYPDLIDAARRVQNAGGEQITVHLREDRRHIQDLDVKQLKSALQVPLNLEMAATPEMIRIASKIGPHTVCLVPEKRRELTTEGGLAVDRQERRIGQAIYQLKARGIRVSLFIEANLKIVKLCKDLGADAVEFHTGSYCTLAQKIGSLKGPKIDSKLKTIRRAAESAHLLGLNVHAGHGLDAANIRPLVAMNGLGSKPLFEEYNIGHSIICRAVLVGLEQAVREMVSSIRAP